MKMAIVRLSDLVKYNTLSAREIIKKKEEESKQKTK